MSNEKILIVDDQPEIIDLIKFILKKQDFKTVSASNGKDGLSMALSESPDLILLDISMPDMSGYEVCEKLKSNSQTAKIPIIMLTARDMGEDFEKALEKKADWYITKPFDPKHLLKRITYLLQKLKEKEIKEKSQEITE